MRRAYSYVRFSSQKQLKGASLARQSELRDAYLKLHPDLVLDDLRLEDLGISGYRGKNREPGTALAGFVEAIRVGKVPFGSSLIVENLDRLSRDEVGKALQQFISILIAGVNIVTLDPERSHTADSINRIEGLLEPILVMQRAWEESERKSHRGSDSWVRLREEARTEKKPIRGPFPAWIKLAATKKFELIPDKVETVKTIFQWAREGYGAVAVRSNLSPNCWRPLQRAPSEQT